ncbi:MAG: radical SAM protein [Chloroflexi bacterium]|nr:radical SAM protein [Chloroflexota bacterium]
MDVFEKIKLTAFNVPFEAAEDIRAPNPNLDCLPKLEELKARFPLTQAHLPNGRTIPLLKTMQSSACERNCNYCCFRAGRDTPRASLTPDELAAAVVKLTRAGIVKGLFLSSGLASGGIRTQDRLISTAEILRYKYDYKDYIHLKIMPGAEKDQVLRAMQLADRVSINLEAPNETNLSRLAPQKAFFAELLKPLEMIESIRQTESPHLAWNGRWPSSCTQFVVGAVGETDVDLLQTTVTLRQKFQISRAYYSNFSPVIHTPFENLPPSNPWRQHRLYQAFFLLRDYRFDFEELPFNPKGDLNPEVDPKLLWAEHHLLQAPIEINTSDYAQLIKIPGIGPQSAKKILEARTYGVIRDIHTLHKMGIATSRASKFILLNGRRPPFQPALF